MTFQPMPPGNTSRGLLLPELPQPVRSLPAPPQPGDHLASVFLARMFLAGLLLVAIVPRAAADLAPPPAAKTPASPGKMPESAPLQAKTADPLLTFDHRYLELDALLASSVQAGLVNYELVQKQLPVLKNWLQAAAALPPETLKAFTRDQQLAFYLNAYNARVLLVIAERLPLSSIREIEGVFDKLTFDLAGKSLTLDQLEHQLIRPTFREPRVHFALNCGAKSCPALQPSAYVAERLDAQLEAATAAFVRNTAHNRINLTAERVFVSKLFEWFGDDFIEKYATGRVRPGISPREDAILGLFARHYQGEKTRALLLEGTPKVGYFDYDWSLNRQ